MTEQYHNNHDKYGNNSADSAHPPKEPKGRKEKDRRLIPAIVLVAVMTIVAVAAYRMLPDADIPEEEDYASYSYHIALISDESDTSFWEDVRDGAAEAGSKYGAYVEQIGEGLVTPPSMEDAINMAIYEHVDGILLRPTEDENVRKMIDKACGEGIPVITLQKDIPDCARQGFVGINDYFLGQEFGRRVLRIAGERSCLVSVLFPGDSFNETSQKWFRLGITNTVQLKGTTFDFQVIKDDRGLNNAEGVIHEMVEGDRERPDIILCLDETLTQSVYRLIKDLGMSDSIRIIGSYISDDILEGILQGQIDSTITVDPQAMGRMGIDALMTYKKHHMVSYYTEVDTLLVDRQSAAEYREGNADGESMLPGI